MKIHFIGIGGIGVSALAQYYLQKGHDISGSDLVASEITSFLAQKGVNIMIGNAAANITQGIELIIHSPAVKTENPELMQAKKYGIKAITYPEALGGLTRDYETIAVAGAHGKSTTTAMIGLLLVKAGIDPTIIVGTKLKELGGTNFRMGASKYLVIEACEYDGSFLNYSPKITVITNIDKEHMDYFKTFANVKKTFMDFIVRLPIDGWLVVNRDEKNLKIKNPMPTGRQEKSKLQFKIQNYGLRDPEAKKLKKILQIPGAHNVSNALAALGVARILGVKDEVSFASLAEYKGSWRRFEMKTAELSGILHGKPRKITVISDYGHHPTEVLATLMGAREKFGKAKIWLIFQPHQHQRTFYLLKDFVKLFKQAKIDHIIITDIYDVAGRETQKINKKISAEALVKKIARKNVVYMPEAAAEQFVKQGIAENDVLIIMGAGDIYKLYDTF